MGDPDYDQVVYQWLKKIFHERFHGNSDQIKEFVCAGLKDDDQESIIKLILELDPDAYSKEFLPEELLDMFPLLWIAVFAGYNKSAELLVRSGADVNELFGRHDPQVYDEKWTVLHLLLEIATSRENERLIRLITDHGADFQARDCTGRTLLHHATRRGNVETIESFLEKGADVNAVDNEGMTPLLCAAQNIQANKLLPLLMKHGADIFVKDSKSCNVLHHLSNTVHKDPKLVRIFIEKGISLDEKEHLSHIQPIHRAAEWENNELVTLFLDHGSNVNALTKKGESPLYLAAHSYTVTNTLLTRGANIDLRTSRGRTVLHAACESAATKRSYWNDGEHCAIRLLLSAGADVLAEDCDGKTPFALFLSDGEIVLRPETWPMIQALALKKALQPSIELKDEWIIERYRPLQIHYRECMDEIDRMQSTRFIHTCTLFELLVKSYCQIAPLMRNPNFETKFKQCDLAGFSIYAKDVRQAFERAQDHYQHMLKQKNIINEAVYDILPHLIVEKIVHCIFDCCKNLK